MFEALAGDENETLSTSSTNETTFIFTPSIPISPNTTFIFDSNSTEIVVEEKEDEKEKEEINRDEKPTTHLPIAPTSICLTHLSLALAPLLLIYYLFCLRILDSHSIFQLPTGLFSVFVCFQITFPFLFRQIFLFLILPCYPPLFEISINFTFLPLIAGYFYPNPTTDYPQTSWSTSWTTSSSWFPSGPSTGNVLAQFTRTNGNCGGNFIGGIRTLTLEQCAQECLSTPDCAGFSFNHHINYPQCITKSAACSSPDPTGVFTFYRRNSAANPVDTVFDPATNNYPIASSTDDWATGQGAPWYTVSSRPFKKCK